PGRVPPGVPTSRRRAGRRDLSGSTGALRPRRVPLGGSAAGRRRPVPDRGAGGGGLDGRVRTRALRVLRSARPSVHLLRTAGIRGDPRPGRQPPVPPGGASGTGT